MKLRSLFIFAFISVSIQLSFGQARLSITNLANFPIAGVDTAYDIQTYDSIYERSNSMLPEDEQQRLLFEGGYPVLARVAKQKKLPYPHVNAQGEIEADAEWWSTMQYAG